MAHWRDGGIGTMPGSDDRPIEEWTLLEKLAEIAETQPGSPMPKSLGGPNVINWAEPMNKLAQAAFDEIVRLREAIEPAVRIIIDNEWCPIDTAPVKLGHTVPSYYRFRCILQDAQGHVFEGAAYYVNLGRATTQLTLRWQNAMQRQVFPKFWKPLPLPKNTENGGAA